MLDLFRIHFQQTKIMTLKLNLSEHLETWLTKLQYQNEESNFTTLRFSFYRPICKHQYTVLATWKMYIRREKHTKNYVFVRRLKVWKLHSKSYKNRNLDKGSNRIRGATIHVDKGPFISLRNDDGYLKLNRPVIYFGFFFRFK